MRGRKKEKTFLEMNDEYHVLYMEFRKNARIWNGMSQYWLGNESTKRANALLYGNVEEALKPIQSENLYFKITW